MMIQTAEEIIKTLNLVRHPEGGWYRETYRSAETVAAGALPNRFDGERALCTAVYFLLEQGDFSALHRIKSDEIWHFYSGAALTIHMITTLGEQKSLKLGSDITKGERFQAVV